MTVSCLFALKILSALIAVGFTLVITRGLSTESAGNFFFLVNVVILVSVVCRLGFDQILLKSTVEEHGEVSDQKLRLIHSTALTTCFYLSIAIVVIGVVWRNSIALIFLGDGALANKFALIIISVPFVALLNLYSEILRGKRHYFAAVITQNFVMPVFSIIIFVGFLLKGSELPYFSYVVASVFSFICAFILKDRLFIFRDLFYFLEISYLKKLLKASIVLMIFVLNNHALQYVPLFFIKHHISADHVAYFHVANKIALILTLFFGAFNSYLAPIFADLASNQKYNELRNTFIRQTIMMGCGGFLLSLPFLIRPEVFLALFGGEYKVASGALRILILGKCLSLFIGAVGTMLIMVNKNAVILWAIIFSFSSVLTISHLLIPEYAVSGAAIAQECSYLVGKLIMLSYLILFFRSKCRA